VLSEVDPTEFEQVPGTPFAYWVSNRVRRLFRDLPAFDSEEDGRTTRCGLGTTDNFRFLRLHWEVTPAERITNWPPYYDGGVYSLVYDLFPLVVWWKDNGQEIKKFIAAKFGSASRKVQGEDYYKKPGFVFPRRTRGLCPKVMAPGGIFSNAGQAGFVPRDELLATIGFMSSEICSLLVSLSQGRTGDAAQFEVGLIKRLPWLGLNEGTLASRLRSRAMEICNAKRHTLEGNELSHVFVAPHALLGPVGSLRDRLAAAQTRLDGHGRTTTDAASDLSLAALEAYQLRPEDAEALVSLVDSEEMPAGTDEDADDSGDSTEESCDLGAADHRSLVTDLISYSVGAVVGRWDIRFATGAKPWPELPDPLEPLPSCSPGMLQGDGLPLRETPTSYPLAIDWEGLLVDDPDHPDDIVRRTRDVLELIWGTQAGAIEKETCDILGVRELRDYFRKTGGGSFWDDHVKRYSRSRRKAPIYWLLQSDKKNYALWVYYHRLDKDLLPKALVNYVEPKIRWAEDRLKELRTAQTAAGDTGREAKRLGREVEKLDDFVSELKDFKDKLRRAANRHLVPDLNDGVVLNIAPLHELVPWKEARTYWNKLLAGEYEWSSISKQLREKGLVK
jgi:hypothetical protein